MKNVEGAGQRTRKRVAWSRQWRNRPCPCSCSFLCSHCRRPCIRPCPCSCSAFTGMLVLVLILSEKGGGHRCELPELCAIVAGRGMQRSGGTAEQASDSRTQHHCLQGILHCESPWIDGLLRSICPVRYGSSRSVTAFFTTFVTDKRGFWIVREIGIYASNWRWTLLSRI